VGNLASAYYWIPEQRERAMPLFEEAIGLAKEGLSRSPEDAVLMSKLAGYYSIVRPDTAGYYTEKAMALDPDNAEVLFRSAATYEQIGERERALVLLGNAISKGFPLKIIENERQFLDLRQDRRYGLLLAGTARAKTE
jgi:serine/threonine-protein kinase